MKTRNNLPMPVISKKLARYRTLAAVIFILVHSLVFLNGYLFLVVLRQSIFTFFLIHGSLVAAAGFNLFVGPDLYLKYLRRKAKRLDPILVNRVA